MSRISRLTSLFLAVLFVLSAFTANTLVVFAKDADVASVSASGTTGQCTWTLSGGVLTIKGNGYMADYSYDYYPPWQYYDFTKVVISDGVKDIGEYAFYKFSTIRSVVIGNGVTTIGEGAFSNCTYLSDLSLSDTVTTIKGYAFQFCASLRNLTLPDSVTEVEPHAFDFCDNLETVTLGKGFTREIMEMKHALECSSAFNSTSLKNIYVSKDNPRYVSIDGVLYDKTTKRLAQCPPMKTTVNIPDWVTTIGGCSFYRCSNITDIHIPDNITTIEMEAFMGCTSLNKVTIPSSVNTIDIRAFGYDVYDFAIYFWPDIDITICGYEGSAAQRYAQENDIEFEEIKQTSYLEIYSDRVELSVRKGERIIVGAGIVQDGERVTDISMLSCSVSDPSVLSAISTTTKENCRIYTFDALSPGVTYITFSDSKTGLVKKVPITVYDKNVMAYTVSSVSTQKIEKYTTNFYNVNGLYVDSYTYTENKDGSAVLKFDVYNTNHTYGAVEVFDKDGIMQGAVVIDKMTNNGGSLKSTLWDNTLCIVRDTIDGDWLSYRQESGFSKKTPVEVKVPKDGYIKITIDADESFLVALINGLDIAMSVKSLYGDIKNYDVNSKLFVENLTAELVRNAAYAEFVKDSSEYSKHLMKDFVKETTVFSGKSVGNFADNFVNNLSELKLEELIWDMAEDFGWSTGQSLFEYFSGPVGAAMKGMFMFGDICELAIQNNDLINYTYSGSIVIQNQGGYNRVSSQVKVSSETAFGNEVALRVFEVSVNSREYENIKTFNPELYEKIASVPSQVYNISMIKNGVETQPEGKVEVSIPVPENMKHLARNGKIKVYRIEEDGTRTEMQVKVQNGLLIFNTDHFSLYVIMGDEMLGDADGDGEVTIMDATEVQLAVAKVIALSEDRNRCADADRDGETTIMDATQIQKFVARVITQF